MPRASASASRVPAYDPPAASKLFASLAAMRTAMATADNDTSVLDDVAFEDLIDHLVIATPATQFGRYKFQFCGSTVVEMARHGDMAGLTFGDVMVDDASRQTLAAFKHVENLSVSHVTANQLVPGSQVRLYTRLIMPLFVRHKVALMVSAVAFHDAPITLDRTPPLVRHG